MIRTSDKISIRKRNALRQRFASGLTVPLLVGFGLDFALYEKLRELRSCALLLKASSWL
jgi:hypothetical protein